MVKCILSCDNLHQARFFNAVLCSEYVDARESDHKYKYAYLLPNGVKCHDLQNMLKLYFHYIYYLTAECFNITVVFGVYLISLAAVSKQLNRSVIVVFQILLAL